MSKHCCILNCKLQSYKNSKQKISCFRIPSIIGLNNRRYKTIYNSQKYRLPNSINETADKVIALSKERQIAWVKVINRGELNETQMKTFRVCSKHFISGKPADLFDRDNPDWVPCQSLGYTSSLNSLKMETIPEIPQSSAPNESVTEDSDIYLGCNRSFKTFDAKMKVDHSLCVKRPRLEMADAYKRVNELNKSVQLTEFKKVAPHSQISPKAVQHRSKNHKENLLSPSTTANFLISTTKLKSPATANLPLPNNMNLIICQERRNKLHELLARSIYSTSSPMDMTENLYWKQFFKAIRPTYFPPTALDLRGYLLNNEYERVMKSVQEKISTTNNYVLVTYGWSSPKGEIHFVVTTPEPVYFKCLVSKEERSKLYISEQIVQVIENLGSDKLMLLLTDDAPNMTKACEIVSDAYPHITVSKSGSEDLKLLLEDLIKLTTVQEILNKAKEMILSINLDESNLGKNNEQAKNLLQWDAIPTLKTLIENKSAFQVDIIPDDMIPEEVRQKTCQEDEEFWIEAERILELLDYISEEINTLEVDKALLSNLPNVFARIQMKLLSFCKECTLLLHKEKDNICSYISLIKKSTIKSIHRAANLLDPRYRGANLDNTDLLDAIQFLKQRCDQMKISEAKLCANLDDYRTSSGSYSRSFLWGSAKHISPIEWWISFCWNEPLSRFAVQLLNVSPSPAIYQRIFKDVEMNPRHGLDPEGLAKLITIKMNLLASKNSKPETLDSILSS